MPVADAGAGLPRLLAQPVAEAALDIVDQGGALIRRQLLGGGDDLDLAVAGDALAVVMRERFEPDAAEGQAEVVEIDHVGPVFLDQILLAEQPFGDVVRISGGANSIQRPLWTSCQSRIACALSIPRAEPSTGRYRAPAGRDRPTICRRRRPWSA
jgi:hypothetical protein